MRTAFINLWGMVKKPAVGAFAMWALVIVLTTWVVTFKLARDLYAKEEFSQVIIFTLLLSLAPTIAQMCYWCRAQWHPKYWCATIRKAWQEIIVGVAMHYPAILIGVSLGSLTSPDNCTKNGVDSHTLLVAVQQVGLTSATWLLFGERLRKRIPPRQPNQPAVARKEDKQMPVVLALLTLLAVVAALTVFASTKKGNKRRRK